MVSGVWRGEPLGALALAMATSARDCVPYVTDFVNDEVGKRICQHAFVGRALAASILIA